MFCFFNFYFRVKLEIMFQTIKKCRANSSVYKLYIKTRHYTFRGDMKVGRWFPTESAEPMPEVQVHWFVLAPEAALRASKT